MADPLTCLPLIPASILHAHSVIKPYIHRTPLLTCKTIDRIASSPRPESPDTPTPNLRLFFKCENLQKIGAFKARGAHHAVLHLIEVMGIEEVRRRGVVTHSSGNHAQALALAAHTFNIPAYIVMPTISTPSKIAGTRLYTDHVIFSGSTSDEREAKVKEVVEETGAVLVPPYDHPDIILGQGTVGFEIDEQHRVLVRAEEANEGANGRKDGQVPGSETQCSEAHSQHQNGGVTESESERHLHAIMVPLGGGGLLGGIATYFSLEPSSAKGKKTHIFGCEPSFAGADDARRGLASVPPKRIEHVSSLTIADGLRTPVGVLNWSIVSDEKKVTAVYAVSEEEIKMAMRVVFERMKVVVEPSACVGLATVLYSSEWRRWVYEMQKEERERNGGKEVVWDVGIVFSGGNTTVEAVAELFGKSKESVEGNREGERKTGQVGMDGKMEVEDIAG